MTDAGGGGATTAGMFRSKVAMMKSWKPESQPSNRDKLEIYALHKQAVSGDAPDEISSASNADSSVADRAKLNAWRTKKGMSRNDAMAAYCAEVDRQVRVYGTASDLREVGDSRAAAATTPIRPGTPTNTPSAAGGKEEARGGGAGTAASAGSRRFASADLLTPRGVAAVPLLCAAAAESRPAYLSRLRGTGPPANGWWAKQEPLCADPGTVLAIPEGAIISSASLVEWISLSLGAAAWSDKVPIPLPPRVVQAYLWPLHNVLLTVWIVLVFISTLCGSVVVAVRTVLIGSKRTGAPLDRLFAEEIYPASRAASSLCEPHQAIAVRLAGLALMPFVTLCDASRKASDAGGILAGSAVYVSAAVVTWWYWLCVLPWLAFAGICTSIAVGWCCALIELAGM